MCEINSFTYVIYASILFVSVENDVIPFIWPVCYSAVGVMRRGRDSKGDDRSRCPSAPWRPKPCFLTGHSDVTGDAFVPPGDAFVPISYKNECFFFFYV